MVKYHEEIREKIDSLLNDNPYGILFDVSLYNSKKIKYEKSFDIDDYKVETKRVVPVNIVNISGDFINIPDTNALSLVIEMDFDIFVGTYSDMSFELQERFRSVDYNNTLLAINDFRKKILAKYIPLGTVGLMMGGDDSSILYNISDLPEPKLYYMKFTPYNNESEVIATFDNGMKILKTSSGLLFYYTPLLFISLPYTVNQEVSIVAYYNGTNWVFKNNLGNEVTSPNTTYEFDSVTTLTIGSQGFEGIVNEFGVSTEIVTSYDFNNISNIDYIVLVQEFTNRYYIDDESNVISNSILWGSGGNAVFGFKKLIPISDIKPVGEYHYQEFGLDLPSVISEDILFGNLFEYFIDGIQVYPVDRQHTWGGDSSMEQKVNQEYATGIGEVSQKEITKTFFYKPNKKLTKLLKQITSNSAKQNEGFELVVQYPFFRETYNVRIDNGGTSPNINEFSTFTVSFKQRDTSVLDE